MHRLFSLLTLFAVAAGCGGDSTGPRRSVADLAGRWEFNVAAAPSCSGAYAATTYYVRIPDVDTGTGTLNIVAPWDVVAQPRYDWRVTGNVSLPSGEVQLNWWHTVLSVGEEMRGTLDAQNQFSGTITDPKPGYKPHWGPSGSSCTRAVTGRRVGA